MVRGCAGTLLAHVNLLLTLYGGAALATGARLKWDPSTYVLVRELLPAEYRVSAATITAMGIALLLLPHLAVLATHCACLGNHARALLFSYAVLMTCMILTEVAYGAWMAVRMLDFIVTTEPQMQTGKQLMEELKPLLKFLARLHWIPKRIDEVVHEAEVDAPRNLYAAVGAAATLALLQIVGVVLALCAARNSRSYHATNSGRGLALRKTTTSADSLTIPYEKMPLRTAYKNGRIVIL